MNKTAYIHNLDVLLAKHRSYARMARALDVSPRHLYRTYGTPNAKLSKLIACKARVLRLRALINVLRERGAVTDKDLMIGMKLVNIQMRSK